MRFFVFLIAASLAVGSCTTQRTITNNYLLNASDTSGRTTVNLAEPVIQKDDLLSIKVYSTSLDPKIDAPYNLPEQTVVGSSTTTATAGFLVNEEGNIEFPRLGTFHVEGLTKKQLIARLKDSLTGRLNNPTVIVRFLNFRITVLGEVRSPSTFNIPTERVTILEALGLAGDITEFGNKNTVKVSRQKEGQQEIGVVDLTSKNLFSSPYFRLQQNDYVIVEQTRRKLQQQEQQNVAQQIGIATGVITAIALIITIIRR